MLLALVAAVAGGLLVGSLSNVVCDRLPRRKPLLERGSRCRSCEQPSRAYDNVPLLSWLVLRGRCRDCGEPISPRYPLVEALTAALFAAVVAVHYEDVPQLVLGLVLVAFLVPLTLIDLELRILPDRLTGPAVILGLAVGTGLDPDDEVERLLAAASAGAFFVLAWSVKPAGLGLGDVKLAAVLGLFLGREVAVAVFAALALGVIVGGVIMSREGVAAGRKTAVAFGPFLAVGGVLSLLVGDPLVDAYLNTF